MDVHLSADQEHHAPILGLIVCMAAAECIVLTDPHLHLLMNRMLL